MENLLSVYYPNTAVIVSIELSKRNWLVASLTRGAGKPSLRTIQVYARIVHQLTSERTKSIDAKRK